MESVRFKGWSVMDLTTIIGLIVGIASLIVGFVLEGGVLGALIEGTAALIVFGGTIGAIIISFPSSVLKEVPRAVKYAFFKEPNKPEEMIQKIVELANLSRREGLLALESQVEELENDEFLLTGIQLIVDGVDAESIEDILNRDIELREQNVLSIGRVFESAGGFAPTMGIIGTVMGLVHVLGSLEKPDTLGPSIAVAFIATLYGVASANLIYLPLYGKIKGRLAQEVLIKEIQIEGLLSIVNGENTTLLKNKLTSFLDSNGKRRLSNADEAGEM